MHIFCCLPIQTSDAAFAMEGRLEAARQALKRRCYHHRVGTGLQRAFAIHEIEQFVFDHRATEAPAVLAALKWQALAPREIRKTCRLITERAESLAMDGVRASARGKINGARRRQFGGKIERRPADVELLNRAHRNVLCSRSYRFVADVQAVNFNSGCTPKHPINRNRTVSRLGRVKRRAVLHLNTRFKLRKIKEVPPVHWKVIDLFAAQYSLHRCLLSINRNGGALYLDHGGLLTEFKLDVTRSRNCDLNHHRKLRCLETLRLDANDIVPRDQTA